MRRRIVYCIYSYSFSILSSFLLLQDFFCYHFHSVRGDLLATHSFSLCLVPSSLEV